MQKVAFLDRDGTIIWEPPRPPDFGFVETFPLKGLGEVRFLEGVFAGLEALKEKGYRFVIATNQSNLGTPRNPREIYDQVMEKITSVLKEKGIDIDFVMVCPHHPDAGCECRKPKIGGLTEFLATHDVDFKNSLMFGDRDTDEEFAKNLGVHFVRVMTNGTFELPDAI